MDAGFAETFQWALDNGLADVILSYDIACKYSVNFLKRVKTSPDQLLPEDIDKHIRITWLIGKFHLGGHKEECAKMYSFNYNKNVGRMSGELVETIWATFNALKPQTREMGPGPRREMLTDAMNFWNKMKEGRLSTCMLCFRVIGLCLGADRRIRRGSEFWEGLLYLGRNPHPAVGSIFAPLYSP